VPVPGARFPGTGVGMVGGGGGGGGAAGWAAAAETVTDDNFLREFRENISALEAEARAAEHQSAAAAVADVARGEYPELAVVGTRMAVSPLRSRRMPVPDSDASDEQQPPHHHHQAGPGKYCPPCHRHAFWTLPS